MKVKYPIYQNINIREYLISLGMSKSVIYKFFLNKQIFVNNNLANERLNLKENDILEIDYKEENNFSKEEGNLDILYEDDYFLIINKTPGVIVHDDKNSLCNIISSYYDKNNINLSVKYPHRLDKDTSGIIIFTKDLLTLDYMNKLFTTHDLVRKYTLICEGKLQKRKGSINLNIGKDRHVNGKMRVSKTGLNALTLYEVIKEDNDKSLVEVELKTGRTHQIRVHFSYIGHPLLGDELYGSKVNLDRFMLHSSHLEFFHPFLNKKIIIDSSLPKDFIERLV